MKQEQHLRLISLQAENVKRLKAIAIDFPEGQTITRIKGANGAGKTSVLDSIAYALAGKAIHPEKPIREGEETATVVLDIGDLIVQRRWTKKDSYLTVQTREGATFKSPQAMLDALWNQIAFDPLEFQRMDRKEQFETLRRLVGVNFSDLDTARATAYDKRAQVHRDLKRLEGERDGIQVDPNAPMAPVDVKELVETLEKGEKVYRIYEQKAREIEMLQAKIADGENRIEEIEKEAAQVRAIIKQHHGKAKDLREDIETFTLPDIEATRSQIAGAEEINAKVRARERRNELQEKISEAQRIAQEHATQIANADRERRRRIEEAKFPVEGLGFEEGSITFNGLPFAQASSAEQLRVSVGIACAMSPKLRLMLIRDGSLLDDNSLALLTKLATDHNAQVLLESVASDDDTRPGVLIEDGAVKRIDKEK